MIEVHLNLLLTPENSSCWVGEETPNYVRNYFRLPLKHVPKRIRQHSVSFNVGGEGLWETLYIICLWLFGAELGDVLLPRNTPRQTSLTLPTVLYEDGP